MTINSRAKGARGEREFAQYLRDHGWAARRGQQFSGSPDSPDVVTDIPGIQFEVKRVEKGSLYAWLSQATQDTPYDKIPIVAHRRSHEDWIAILPMRDLLELIDGRDADLRDMSERKASRSPEGNGGRARGMVATGRRRAPPSRV